MEKIKQILCPVDFSEASVRSTEDAISLLRQLGYVHPEKHMHLLHVYSLPMYTLPDGGMVVGPEMVTQIMTHADQSMHGFIAKMKSRHGLVGDVQWSTQEGNPSDIIIEKSEKLGVDLIVIGTHGRKGLSHFWLGSVAEKVVRSSNIDVMTVRTPE